jgi:hypothetical protein
VRRDQFTDAAAVHIQHVRKIQNYVLITIADQPAHDVTEGTGGFSELQLAYDVDDHYALDETGAGPDTHWNLLRVARLENSGSLGFEPVAL